MADLLDATVGGAAANAYVTIVGATGWLAMRLHTEPWLGAQDNLERAAALMWATRLLDEQVDWVGTPATTTQALMWPQTGQVDPAGHTIASTIIPDVVQRATAFYALALLRDTSEVVASARPGGIKSRKLGETTIVYQDDVAPRAPAALRMPTEIQYMLSPYGTIRGGVMIPLFRS